jgi:GNAT superfamily N-acetyltransferase
MTSETHNPEFSISTDPIRLDVDFIHNFLSTQCYWALGRPLEVVRQSILNSLCFGVYYGVQQVGFARVVTDYATFAWVCDVFIATEFRGLGLGKMLVQSIIEHPRLSPLRRIMLATRDAHSLYQKYGGFKELATPERWMERFQPNIT